MTGKELFLEIGNIREEYVTEAENYRARTGGSILVGWNRKVASSPAFRKTLATAACLVVCAGRSLESVMIQRKNRQWKTRW